MSNTATRPAAANYPETVSRKTTFDGVTIYLHADGQVSNRSHFYRGRLPVEIMWRVWGDICTYTAEEIPSLIKAARKGTWVPVRIRPRIDHEGILARQVRSRGFNPRTGYLEVWS